MFDISYARCKLLSMITFGRRRIHYRNKCLKVLKNQNVIHGNLYNDILISPESGGNIFINVQGKGNKIYVMKSPSSFGRVNITVEGNNNDIFIKNVFVNGFVDIKCYGDNGVVKTGSMSINDGLSIINGSKTNWIFSHGSKIEIGENMSAEYLTIWNNHSDANVIIGKDCMISHSVLLQNSDTHPIYDLATKKIINKPVSGIVVGNHVWLSLCVTIMKNSFIADNCIVGRNALVTKKFEEPNNVIAGIPAKIVRKGIEWQIYDDDFFV